jgi:LysR family transcriptional regulator (chromosome initiation inhibitor)
VSPAFAARWFPDGPTVTSLSRAPVVLSDHDDRLQDRYLRRRTRRHLDPPRHHVPGSDAFVQAVRLAQISGRVSGLGRESPAAVALAEPLDHGQRAASALWYGGWHPDRNTRVT